MSAMDPELYTIGLTYSHPSAPDSPFASEPGLRLDAEQEAIVLLQLSQPVVLETFVQTCECLFHDRHAWLPMLVSQIRQRCLEQPTLRRAQSPSVQRTEYRLEFYSSIE